MKTLLMMFAATGLALTLGACETTHVDTTKNNWDGSVTHKDMTITEYPNGKTTVDSQKTTTR